MTDLMQSSTAAQADGSEANSKIAIRNATKRPRLKNVFDLSTVIKIDSDETVRSGGSWRLPLDLLGRLSRASSRNSTSASSKISEDSISRNRTVLTIDEQSSMTPEPQITVISVERNLAESDSDAKSTTEAIPELDPAPSEPQPSTSERTNSEPVLPEMRPLPPFLGPLPPLIFPPFLPPPPPGWFPPPPGMLGAATPPIELTHWRMNPNFDPNPGLQRERETQHNRQTESQPNSRNNTTLGNVLLPDNLPRLFPGSNIPPFIRLEEDLLDDELKGCCGRISQSAMIRCFVAVISAIGLACVIVGIVLGALTVSGTTRLTLCLLMIGVGIVLMTVSVIAWRLTRIDLSTQQSLWGFLSTRSPLNHTVFPHGNAANPSFCRARTANLRPPHPFHPGMMMPDFTWRPPPPSYQTSVRDMRFQRLFENRQTQILGSPPPTYRSTSTATPRPSVTSIIGDHSRPPSYRSHESLNLIEERAMSQMEVAVRTDATVPQTSPDNDREQLLTSNISQPESGNFNVAYVTASSGSVQITVGQDDDDDEPPVSVIDCSTAVPVGFEVGSGSNRSRKRRGSLLSTPRPRRHRNPFPAVSYVPEPPCSPRNGNLIGVSDFFEITEGPSYV